MTKLLLLLLIVLSSIGTLLGQIANKSKLTLAEDPKALKAAEDGLEVYTKSLNKKMSGLEAVTDGKRPELKKDIKISIYTIQLNRLSEYTESDKNPLDSVLTQAKRRVIYLMTYGSNTGFIELEKVDNVWKVRSITGNSRQMKDLLGIVNDRPELSQPALIKIPWLNQMLFGRKTNEGWRVRILGENSIGTFEANQEISLREIIPALKKEAARSNGLPR